MTDRKRSGSGIRIVTKDRETGGQTEQQRGRKDGTTEKQKKKWEAIGMVKKDRDRDRRNARQKKRVGGNRAS